MAIKNQKLQFYTEITSYQEGLKKNLTGGVSPTLFMADFVFLKEQK